MHINGSVFYDKRNKKKQYVQAEHVQHRDVYHNDAALTYLCEIFYSLNSEFQSCHQRIGMEWCGCLSSDRLLYQIDRSQTPSSYMEAKRYQWTEKLKHIKCTWKMSCHFAK